MNGNTKKMIILVAVMLAVTVLIPLIALAASKWAFTSGVIVLFALFGVLLLALLGALIAVLNRKTELNEDGFTYRTWLGNEYEYSYKDVIWYHESDHNLWLHTRDKLLIIDGDFEIGAEMAKRLKSFGIPDHDVEAAEGVFDNSGEPAQRVLYLDQTKKKRDLDYAHIRRGDAGFRNIPSVIHGSVRISYAAAPDPGCAVDDRNSAVCGLVFLLCAARQKHQS